MKLLYRCLLAMCGLSIAAGTSAAILPSAAAFTAVPNAGFVGAAMGQPDNSQLESNSETADSNLADQLVQSVADVEFSENDIAAAQQVTQSLGISEWLGPLAPLALSPFFGIACLSGLSLYGGDWFGMNNPFIGEGSPLRSETVFAVFLFLTVITSLPRLTKISKPFVQMTDQLEAWAGILTMLVLKFLVTGEVVEASPENQVVMLGVFSTTAEVFLMGAAVLNVLVINSVKFFCEMLIWVIPVPAIDAAFEALNKSVCAALMLVYGYSPYLATCINLCIFLVAAIVFRWVYRQELYFRTVLFDAAWQKLFPPKAISAAGLTVFPNGDFNGVKSRSRCLLLKTDDGWQLIQRRRLRSDVILPLEASQWTMAMSCGLIAHEICLERGDEKARFTFTRKYHLLLPELCESLGVSAPPKSRSTADDETLTLLPR